MTGPTQLAAILSKAKKIIVADIDRLDQNKFKNYPIAMGESIRFCDSIVKIFPYDNDILEIIINELDS
jgi:hypothetical protein